MRLISVGLVVVMTTLIGACQTAPVTPTGTSVPVMKDVPKATVSRQEGYLQIEVQNALHDAGNPVLAEVAAPYAMPEERLRRARDFPLQVAKGLEEGTIKPAGTHTYIVCLWNTDRAIPSSSVTGWRRNASSLSAITVEDLSGRSNVCDSNSLGGKPLGMPDRIFRVRAAGGDRMVAISLPWVMLTSEAAIMVCSGEKPTVYPGGDKGLWLSPRYLTTAMKGWEYVVMPITHEQ
jgi:hypothetical protein